MNRYKKLSNHLLVQLLLIYFVSLILSPPFTSADSNEGLFKNIKIVLFVIKLIINLFIHIQPEVENLKRLFKYECGELDQKFKLLEVKNADQDVEIALLKTKLSNIKFKDINHQIDDNQTPIDSFDSVVHKRPARLLPLQVYM